MPNFLHYCLSLNSKLVLNFNITNFLDLLLNNIKKDISLQKSNNSKNKIKLVNINNNKKNIKLVTINK